MAGWWGIGNATSATEEAKKHGREKKIVFVSKRRQWGGIPWDGNAADQGTKLGLRWTRRRSAEQGKAAKMPPDKNPIKKSNVGGGNQKGKEGWALKNPGKLPLSLKTQKGKKSDSTQKGLGEARLNEE